MAQTITTENFEFAVSDAGAAALVQALIKRIENNDDEDAQLAAITILVAALEDEDAPLPPGDVPNDSLVYAALQDDTSDFVWEPICQILNVPEVIGNMDLDYVVQLMEDADQYATSERGLRLLRGAGKRILEPLSKGSASPLDALLLDLDGMIEYTQAEHFDVLLAYVEEMLTWLAPIAPERFTPYVHHADPRIAAKVSEVLANMAKELKA